MASLIRFPAAGRSSGDLVHPPPFCPEFFRKEVKSKVADLKNINGGEGAGSSAAAAFLSNFVGDTEWAHLDIAGTAWGTADRDYVGGGNGGTGVGVRLLMNYLNGQK